MSISASRTKGNDGCRRSGSPVQPAATTFAPRRIDARNAVEKPFMSKTTRKRRQGRPNPTEPPQFANQFLASTHDAFARRVRKWGRDWRTRIELDELRPVYWFAVFYRPAGFCGVILTVDADQNGIVAIRNTRGRNLLVLGRVQLPDDAKAIIELFEWTRHKAHSLSGGEMDNKSRVEFVERWKPSGRATGPKRP